MQPIPHVLSRLHSVRCLTRDRVVAALAFIVAAAWLYLFYLHTSMQPMTLAEMAVPSQAIWTWSDFIMMLIMWAVMMLAMMLPSALPMILLFDKLGQSRGTQPRTQLFIAGYMVQWFAFSVAATVLQWILHAEGFLSAMDSTSSPKLGGAVLITAGIYQWTSIKLQCLSQCRSPLSFLLTHWRDGASGAWIMGLQHGAYCVGCCWALMLVLFVVGVMNLFWIVIISVFVLLEKLLLRGKTGMRAAGAMLILWGAGLIFFH
ncbi:MAG: DUF2182 domain-containing protein [Burkholderiales bacterium]